MTLSDLNTTHVLTAWIAALWSGEYDKVQGAFRNTDGFCVQGVLYDQVAKVVDAYSGVEYSTLPASYKKKVGLYDTIHSDQFLNIVYEVIPDLDGFDICNEDDPITYLFMLNDNTDATFEEMGHVIYALGERFYDLDMPPKEDIRALADDGSCDVKGKDDDDKCMHNKILDDMQARTSPGAHVGSLP